MGCSWVNFTMNVDLWLLKEQTASQNILLVGIFNAAQPGVGRVQVLGSKSLEAADYLAIKSLEVDQRVPGWRALEGDPRVHRPQSQGVPSPLAPHSILFLKLHFKHHITYRLGRVLGQKLAFCLVYKVLQFWSNWKFAKAELYWMGGFQDEWFELTYYIETLLLGTVIRSNWALCNSIYLERFCSNCLFTRW